MLPTTTPRREVFLSDSMSNLNDVDIATLYRMIKQFEYGNQQGIQPQPSTGPQNPTSEAQRPLTQRLSPTRPRLQPYRQPARNVSEFSTLFRDIDEIKRGQEEMRRKEDAILAALNRVYSL